MFGTYVFHKGQIDQTFLGDHDEHIIWLNLAWDSWTEYELYYGRIRYDFKALGDQWLYNYK